MATLNITRSSSSLWPSLPYENWNESLDTLHMWMQIVGKIKLELCPFINQWWEVVFYVTSRGMTTEVIPYKERRFEVNFDFIDHVLYIFTSDGQVNRITLKPRSVADFYDEFMSALKRLDIRISIYPVPVEFADPIPFKEDTKHSSYDKEYVEKWWRIQLQVLYIFTSFRSSFRGKSSPIQFFWGSFDLNGTRFSGRLVTPPKIDGFLGKIMQFAENEENFAFGFWPGDKNFPHPAFYTYIYPAPKGLETINTGPSIAYYNANLSECILPYEDVLKTNHPEKHITNFLETTYKESAKLSGWDIASLEGAVPSG